MPQIIVQKNFKHAVKGDIYPTEFIANEKPVEVDDETAKIAIENAWAKPAKPGSTGNGKKSGQPAAESSQSGKD